MLRLIAGSLALCAALAFAGCSASRSTAVPSAPKASGIHPFGNAEENNAEATDCANNGGRWDSSTGTCNMATPPPTIANVLSRGSDCDYVCNAWNGNYQTDPFGTLAGHYPAGDVGGMWTITTTSATWCAHTGNATTDPLIDSDPQLQKLMTAMFNLGWQPGIQPADLSSKTSNGGLTKTAALYDATTNTILWDQHNVNEAATMAGQSANQVLFHELVHAFINFEMAYIPYTTQSMQVGSYTVSYDLSQADARDAYAHALVHNALYDAYSNDTTGAIEQAFGYYGTLKPGITVKDSSGNVLSASAVKSVADGLRGTKLNTPVNLNMSVASAVNTKGGSCPASGGSLIAATPPTDFITSGATYNV